MELTTVFEGGTESVPVEGNNYDLWREPIAETVMFVPRNVYDRYNGTVHAFTEAASDKGEARECSQSKSKADRGPVRADMFQ